jgi:hypothetical protein
VLYLEAWNLDKFESHSSNFVFLGYTPHGRSYRVFNLETNTVVESCDVTFDETAEDEPLLPSTSSPALIPASTLEAEPPQATTSSTMAVEASRVEGEIISEQGAPLTFRRHIHLDRS